jgi:2-polyprenyl-3-methyl-5-hydroxy-6-metoxy-1,4-benzoquinol methylase
MRAKDWDNLAENYHEFVISPFQGGVKNPLLKELKKIKNSKDLVIADIGCGRGEIADFLAKNFKRVFLMDFSPRMIDVAKKNSNNDNIEFFVRDTRKLREFRNKFDVVVSVNAILCPKISDVKNSLRSVFSTLKDEGMFFGVFPSMGSILYQGFLILEEQLKKYNDERKAVAMTKRILERKKYNFINGTYNDDGEVQKFYYDFELMLRLKDAGFKDIKLSKVKYPWNSEISDHEDFPDKPEMWDWFVSARK